MTRIALLLADVAPDPTIAESMTPAIAAAMLGGLAFIAGWMLRRRRRRRPGPDA